MDNDLLKTIESIGFRTKESQVYLALLELGTGSVSQIAKNAELKRPVTYVILENLIEQGYVAQVPGGKINRYQAVDPSAILIRQKTNLKNFSEMLPLLQTLSNKGKQRPKIHYVETKEGITNVYERLNHAKEAFYVSSYKKLHEHFPKKIEEWMKDYGKGIYSVNAKHIIPDDPEELKFGKTYAESGQKVRALPKQKNFDTDIVLTENKLSVSSLEEEPFLVLIESEKLAKSLKPLFEIIWEASREI
jgi:HTH-type transcriptional regulator, sugar sensing transcriptional regulator